MEQDKEKDKMLINPSFRKTEDQKQDLSEIDIVRHELNSVSNALAEEQNKNWALERFFRKNQSQITLMFLGIGVIIGFILGAILL